MRRVSLLRLKNGRLGRGSDRIAGEEPLEIRVDRHPLAVTMRTPGEDFELAAGFLFSEGVLSQPDQVRRMVGGPNVVDVRLRRPIDLSRFSRHVYTTSSCGVCGKASLELVQAVCPRSPVGAFELESELITRLPDRLRPAQELFALTGGLHGCGLFSTRGELLRAREDVGRHNALDKLIGSFWLEQRVPLDDRLLLLSGRASFELVQKAVLAGVAMVVAVGAPSSLAVELAASHGVTLVGFACRERLNVYSGFERIRR
ncbi:formate dehydrogenase accessory sulfurtransferase FdhD [bacterium CPR1]|nr:formate dehydrogenase accessory sulfurtransferase FdhD [bacterium CPR1]